MGRTSAEGQDAGGGEASRGTEAKQPGSLPTLDANHRPDRRPGSGLHGRKSGERLSYGCGRYVNSGGAECHHNPVDADAMLKLASTGPSVSLWRRRCPLPHLRAGWRPSRSAGWISSPPSPPRRPTTITACRSTRHTTVRPPRRVAGARRSNPVPKEAMAPVTAARTSPSPGWCSLVPEVMSGRHDSNVRPLRPERSALARLSYAPSGAARAFVKGFGIAHRN